MTAAHSDALVFFGITGDLAYKQIFPALQAMVQRGHLDMPIIGVAKSGWNVDQLKDRRSGQKYIFCLYGVRIGRSVDGHLRRSDRPPTPTAAFASALDGRDRGGLQLRPDELLSESGSAIYSCCCPAL